MVHDPYPSRALRRAVVVKAASTKPVSAPRRAVLSGLGLLVGAALIAAWQRDEARALAGFAWRRLRGGRSVAQRVAQHEDAVRRRLQPLLAAAGLASVPQDVALLAFKDSRRLQLHARDTAAQPWRFVTTYRIQGASGGPGPKLREGDGQVPEGVYRVTLLNPNSRFHLSLRLDYPNDFDRRMAEADGRRQLGGDVMIHGTAASIGCVAVGNDAAEDLFVLAAWVGVEHLRVVISPTDFRHARAQAPIAAVPWAGALYATLRSELSSYPHP
jgi:L,D-transpeptidase catalytic domain